MLISTSFGHWEIKGGFRAHQICSYCKKLYLKIHRCEKKGNKLFVETRIKRAIKATH